MQKERYNSNMDAWPLSRIYKLFAVSLTSIFIFILASWKSQRLRNTTVTIFKSATGAHDNDVYNYAMTSMTYGRNYLTEEVATKLPSCDDYKLAADDKQSKMFLQDSTRVYHLGDMIHVIIQLYDGYGHPVTTGGAVVRARMFNIDMEAYATATVTDHGNGSYTAHFEALWEGKATIKAKIAYTPETIRAIYNFRQQLRGTREVLGEFSVKSYKETTLCHPTKKALVDGSHTEICNLTSDNSGMPWFCGKPKNIHLLCEDWVESHIRKPYPALPMTSCEKRLIGRSHVNMKQSLNITISKSHRPGTIAQQSGTRTITLPTNRCKDFNKTALWTWKQPTGFMVGKQWYLRHCQGIDPQQQQLFSCLRNKKLLLFGDSTVRHWLRHIVNKWRCELTTEKWTTAPWHKRTACRNAEYNFTVQWLPHSQPFFGNGTNRYTRTSISRHLEETGSNERVIALIHFYLHALAYHHSVFRERMRRIRASVQNLLHRNKFAKFLIKAPHTYYGSPVGGERLSDFFGLVYEDIMREEFKGLYDQVIYLNNRDITDALDVNFNHPPMSVVEDMVNQMMSYICD